MHRFVRVFKPETGKISRKIRSTRDIAIFRLGHQSEDTPHEPLGEKPSYAGLSSRVAAR